MASDDNLDDLAGLGDDDGLNLDSDSDMSPDLENIMGSELGDDASDGGGGEEDSDLDSFFEDLSSIDDLEMAEGGESQEAEDESLGEEELPELDSEPEESFPEPVAAPVAAPAEPSPKKEEKKKDKPKKEKKPAEPGKMKKIMVYSIILVLFISVGFLTYWFWPQTEDWPSFVEETGKLDQSLTEEEKLDTSTPEMPIQVTGKPRIKRKKEAKAKPIERKRAAPPLIKADKSGRYLIQVATCSYPKCTRAYTQQLKKNGFAVYRQEASKRYDFIEVISKDIYEKNKANYLADKINSLNQRPGYASAINKKKGYHISMGTFPSLERAKEIKEYLETLLKDEKINFNLNHVQQKYSITKIFSGPYKTKSDTKQVLARIKKSRKFSGAFIVRQ